MEGEPSKVADAELLLLDTYHPAGACFSFEHEHFFFSLSLSFPSSVFLSNIWLMIALVFGAWDDFNVIVVQEGSWNLLGNEWRTNTILWKAFSFQWNISIGCKLAGGREDGDHCNMWTCTYFSLSLSLYIYTYSLFMYIHVIYVCSAYGQSISWARCQAYILGEPKAVARECQQRCRGELVQSKPTLSLNPFASFAMLFFQDKPTSRPRRQETLHEEYVPACCDERLIMIDNQPFKKRNMLVLHFREDLGTMLSRCCISKVAWSNLTHVSFRLALTFGRNLQERDGQLK